MGTSIEEKHRSLEPVRQLFFADQPLELHVGTRAEMATIDPASPTETESDWSRLFMLALARQRQGDQEGARQALYRVANMAAVETRVQLWAWKGLQDLGGGPDPASAREVLGVVIEIAMEQGLDTLAVFADGSARFINQSGNSLIWDAHTEQSDAIIRQILDVAQPLAECLPLRPRDPGGLPSNLESRITFLTRSGTAIGSKAYGEEPSPPALGNLLVAGAEMVDFFTLEDLKRTGEHAGVVRYYDDKIRRQPNFAPFYNNRGNARYGQRDVEGSIADFTQAIKLQANYAEAYSNRGVAYHSKGEHKRALADFSQAIRINPSYAPAYNNRSLVYKAQEQYDRAIADCDKAIQLQPNYIEAYRNRGMTCFLMNEPRKALADLEKSVELGGTADQQYQIVVRDARLQLAVPPNVLKKVNMLSSEGIQRAQKNDLWGAHNKFSEVIRLAPNYVGGHSNRGNVRRFQKDYQGAIADYGQAIHLDPKHYEAYFGRGMAYVERKDQDFEKAIAEFSAVIDIQPSFLLAYRMRGVARQKMGDREGAWADLTKYVESGGARQQGEHENMQKLVEELAKMRQANR